MLTIDNDNMEGSGGTVSRGCSVASVDNVYVQTVPVVGREEEVEDLQQTIYYTGPSTQVIV